MGPQGTEQESEKSRLLRASSRASFLPGHRGAIGWRALRGSIIAMPTVTIRVPASTSNLGPGFDCLGVALRLYNEIKLERVPDAAPQPAMVQEAADCFFQQTAIAPFPFTCSVTGEVPPSRGLGSSVTVRLGVLHGLNELSGRSLSREEIFQLCSRLEGHPDNAAPAQFGGFNIVRRSQRQRFAVAAVLKFVLLIPDFEVSTAEARRLLPENISRLAAVESCGNACAIAAAFASGDYANLFGVLDDGLHTPFRKKLIPFFDSVVAAAQEAGALGAFLSGSGSTIAAVTLMAPQRVAAAMKAAAGGAASVLITTADNRGTRVLVS